MESGAEAPDEADVHRHRPVEHTEAAMKSGAEAPDESEANERGCAAVDAAMKSGAKAPDEPTTGALSCWPESGRRNEVGGRSPR